MHILQIAPRIPFPLDDGGAIAVYNVTKALHTAGHRITFLALNTNKHHQPSEVMQGVCERIKTVDINTDIRPYKAFVNLFSTMPYNAERYVSQEFINLVRSEILSAAELDDPFDIIHIEFVYAAYVIDAIRALQTNTDIPFVIPPVVLRTHNVEYKIRERLAANEPNLLKRWYMRLLARRLKALEQRYFQQMDGILAITPEDAQTIRAMGYTGVMAVMPAGVDVEFFTPREHLTTQENTLFFFGSLDWIANQEGVHWFMRAVFPLVRQKFPTLEFHIGGKNPLDDILRYASEQGVTVHPNVPSAPEFMQQFDIMLVPLLSGGGMRVKIVEAMSMGKPIISTRIGAEGIAAEHGINILLADTPEEILHAIDTLLNNPILKQQIGNNARITATERYSWESVTQEGIRLYKHLRRSRA